MGRAMNEEKRCLKKIILELVDQPPGQKLISCKWLYKIKQGIEGVQKPRYKARLVARRFTRRAGIDYNEPLVEKNGNKVFVLKKSLYGLKHLHDHRYKTIDVYMVSNEFSRSNYDSCYFKEFAPADFTGSLKDLTVTERYDHFGIAVLGSMSLSSWANSRSVICELLENQGDYFQSFKKCKCFIESTKAYKSEINTSSERSWSLKEIEEGKDSALMIMQSDALQRYSRAEVQVAVLGSFPAETCTVRLSDVKLLSRVTIAATLLESASGFTL
ncbi:retrovirus-related pol polyprotein from transposon TNT 1-94 [Tanacetum coccineum]